MQPLNHHVQRPLQPVEEFDRAVVGDDPNAQLQIARQRLAHLYGYTAKPGWTRQDMVQVGLLLIFAYGAAFAAFYFLWPSLIRLVME